ncbi:MAG: phosphomannomutase/phosphoglucomutase [Candidatus Woesearchaeota archaeon]
MGIFKAYDIRGIYGDDLTDEIAGLTGKAFVSYVKPKEVVIGHDMRQSSLPLKQALIKGIVSQGANVIDAGLCSTPMLYWLIYHQGFETGIMITASHNPKEYNGFKLVGKGCKPLSGNSGLPQIQELVQNPSFVDAKKQGRVTQATFLKKYQAFLKTRLAKLQQHSFSSIGGKKSTKKQSSANAKPLSLVIDCANGMAGYTLPGLFASLSADYQVEFLYPELDGTFPNHEANPSKPETLTILCKRVKEKNADFGAAFDGDADRIAFVDEKGKIISGDLITALLGAFLLEKNNLKPSKASNERTSTSATTSSSKTQVKATKEKTTNSATNSAFLIKSSPQPIALQPTLAKQKILYEVRSSWAVPHAILAADGIPVLWKAGHSLIKEKMMQDAILFGGEKSGHYFYKDLSYTDSAAYTLLLMLTLLEEKQQPLSALIKPLALYANTGEINIKVSNPQNVLESIKKVFSDATIKEIDGITVEYKDWWFNLRMSNTEPLIRLNLEATTKKLMEEKKEYVLKCIKEAI